MAVAVKNKMTELLAGIEKKYGGRLTVGSMNDVAKGVKAISTGNLAIDHAIGVGGLPLGRSVELFGPPSCGKTTTALQTAVTLQKIIKSGGNAEMGIGPDDFILYLDYEQAMDKKYAVALGLDVGHKSLIFTQPDTLEDGANLAIDMIKTDLVRMVIFDSVAAMNPSAKAEAEIGKSLPAVQAKLLKDFGLNMNSTLYNHNAVAIYLNHLVEVMDMGGGGRRPGMPPRTSTPGGMAMKYFASCRIEYKQIKQNKGPYIDPMTKETQEIVTSTDVRVKVIKNKVAPPFREAVVRVRFGKGFDNFWTALQILLANKKIMHGTGMYYFHNLATEGLAPEWMARAATGTNRPYIRGADNLLAQADAHPEWRDGIIAAAEKVVAENIDALERVSPVGRAEEDFEDEEEEATPEIESGSKGKRVDI